MNKREDYLLIKQNITLKMDPLITKIYSEYQKVTSMILIVMRFLVEKGKSYRLLHKDLIINEKDIKKYQATEIRKGCW